MLMNYLTDPVYFLIFLNLMLECLRSIYSIFYFNIFLSFLIILYIKKIFLFLFFDYYLQFLFFFKFINFYKELVYSNAFLEKS